MGPWKIYYADGSTAEEISFSTAPRTGAICANAYGLRQGVKVRQTIFGGDFYLWDKTNSQLLPMDIFGVIDYFLEQKFILEIKPEAPTLFVTPDGEYDLQGLIWQLAKTDNAYGILFQGRMVADPVYQEVLAAARADPFYTVV